MTYVENLSQDVQQTIQRHREWVDSFGAEGERAVLDGQSFPNVVFAGLDLSGASMQSTVLANCDFSGCTLKMVDFSEANLKHANLSAADLSGSRLCKANLSGADLSNAVLGATEIRDRSGTTTGEMRSDLSGANLAGARLRGTDLSQAITEGATLPFGWRLPEADPNGEKPKAAR